MRAVYHVANRDLTWRERAPLLRHLPDTSAVATVLRDGPHWTLEAYLLDDVRMLLLAFIGVPAKDVKPHPQRPQGTRPPDPARQRKLADARRRARERRALIESGEIT